MNKDIGKRFMEVHRKMRSLNLYKLNDHLNQSEFAALSLIGIIATEQSQCQDIVGVGISMNLLSKEMKVSPAMISKVINGLEEKNYVQRIMDKSDRRGIKVSFTTLGKETFMKEKKASTEFMNKVFNEMGAENVELLISLNEKLCDCIKKEFDLREREKKNAENL